MHSFSCAWILLSSCDVLRHPHWPVSAQYLHVHVCNLSLLHVSEKTDQFKAEFKSEDCKAQHSQLLYDICDHLAASPLIAVMHTDQVPSESKSTQDFGR